MKPALLRGEIFFNRRGAVGWRENRRLRRQRFVREVLVGIAIAAAGAAAVVAWFQ